MERMFYGVGAGCDCSMRRRPARSREQSGFYDFLEGEACEKGDIKKGCINVMPLMPFKMHKFDGKMFCGKRGGEPFLTATRPDYTTGACPSGFRKCS